MIGYSYDAYKPHTRSNKDQCTIFAGRIECRCKICLKNLTPIVMSTNVWEKHTGCRQKNWKKSIKLKGTEKPLFKFVSHQHLYHLGCLCALMCRHAKLTISFFVVSVAWRDSWRSWHIFYCKWNSAGFFCWYIWPASCWNIWPASCCWNILPASCWNIWASCCYIWSAVCKPLLCDVGKQGIIKHHRLLHHTPLHTYIQSHPYVNRL